MIIPSRFVIDSVSLINYFHELFHEKEIISPNARRIIFSAFNPFSVTKLIIPSTVLLELHAKFFVDEEASRKLYYEMYFKIKECPDIEIKPLEREVIQQFISIDDDIESLEHNDKLILSAAMQLNCPIITTDPKIISYVKKSHYLPGYVC